MLNGEAGFVSKLSKCVRKLFSGYIERAGEDLPQRLDVKVVLLLQRPSLQCPTVRPASYDIKPIRMTQCVPRMTHDIANMTAIYL
jgi:hypothetical protein